MKTRANQSRPQAQDAPATAPNRDELQRWIAEAAYYRAEQRGFEPGRETDDWLAAEAEILARVRGSERAPT